jgi:class 3 adenylate cyclase
MLKQMARARMVRARRLRRRPPFGIVMVLLVAGFTAVTGAAIGVLAWRENRATSRALLETVMVQTARLASDHADEFLRSAEYAVQLGPNLVASGQLDPMDERQIERFVLATLRAYPGLTWVSYGSVDDRFVGAWRDAGGTVHVNRSYPRRGKIYMEEHAVGADASRTLVRTSDDHGYRPSQRPYFKAAAESRGRVWTDPYPFYEAGNLGITCAMPVIDADDQLLGVFTVDFSLRQLAEFVERVVVSPRGHVFIADRHGEPIVTPRAAGAAALLARPRSEMVRDVIANLADRAGPFEFDHRGEAYLGHLARLQVGDLRWLVEVIVPVADYTTDIDASARRTAALGVVALVMAVGGGVAMARWTARPLRDLAEAARRIRRGNLDVPPLPTTRDEIGVLGRAMTEMAQALRDREFVRGVLGRFVDPELAARVLQDRDALRLGGELREVTVLFSDLRDFSRLSELLGAEAVIQVVNRHLAAMTPVILRHGGTIVDFLGDGIFVLFGAPFAREDAAAQGLRCAWAMQRAMDELNIENRKVGQPELGLGITVHAGRAVVGNIGSEDRVKYGAVGPPVNDAAHLQAHVRGGEILVSTSVLLRGGGVARIDEPRVIEVKGRVAPMTVYTLTGIVDDA